MSIIHSRDTSFLLLPFFLVANESIIYRRMSDPGTTYRTREEVQRMRSTQDPIRGLQRYIEEWGLATEQELKVGSPLLSLSYFYK